MPVKWYIKGKLVPDDSVEKNEVKYYIIKSHTNNRDLSVFEGHRFFLCRIHNEKYSADKVDIVSSLSRTMPVEFDSFLNGIYLKRFRGLTSKDIINVKLDNVRISKVQGNKAIGYMKYSEIVDILGEEKIDFYTCQD